MTTENPFADAKQDNPFSSPQVGQTEAILPDEFIVDGKTLVCGKKVTLPSYCVKCGADQPEQEKGHRKKKDLYWVNPLIYILIFFQLLIFLVVYLIVRKICKIKFSMCSDCTWKQRRYWLGVLASIGGIVGVIALAVISDQAEIAWIILPLVISMIVFISFANGPLKIKGYKNERFILKGASPAFLEKASMPNGEAGNSSNPFSAVVADDGQMA